MPAAIDTRTTMADPVVAPAMPVRSTPHAAALAQAGALLRQHADEGTRVRLASGRDTAPDVLRVLAQDDRITVRAAVALNPSAPDSVDLLLARDSDERVRALLARKLATLIPTLSRRGQLRLQDQAMITLSGMVESEADRVRQAIADVVKDMPDAPRELILRLAHDACIPVSEPVLRLSPVLTQADLLALLAAPPHAAVATAIAGRHDLPADVADTIAAGEDREAIRALLTNHSANVREAALDALVSRAEPVEAWHDPLVQRPALSDRAAHALSEFVAAHLLTVLASRADLSPATTAALKQRLSARLGEQRRAPAGDPTLKDALHHAHALRQANRLDAAAVRDAVQRGDTRSCTALLAVAAELPATVVERAATMRSAKGVVSLVWMAGLPEDLSPPLQSLLGKVAPQAVLRSPNGRDFPLAVDEMRYQIDLLRRMGR